MIEAGIGDELVLIEADGKGLDEGKWDEAEQQLHLSGRSRNAM